jgi:hypothetical protein
LERIPELSPSTISVSGFKLNIYVFLLTLPVWLLSSGYYVFVYGFSAYVSGIVEVLNYKIFIFLVLGIIVHELLHALTWMVLQKEGFANIKFGFNWQALTPYTHYTKEMQVWKYRLGGIMPGLVMGIAPVIISYVLQNASINFIVFLFVWAATGDIISLWMIRKLKGSQKVKDHPDELGVIVME